MKNGICPKCNSQTVYATVAYDSNFELPQSQNDSFIGKYVNNRIIPSERYVCVTCGYFERYVGEREFLDQITRSNSWIKV